MASIVARHAFGSLRRGRIAQLPRSIHSTPVALKKKSKVDIDDLFGDDAAVEEDLIQTPSPTKAASTAPSTSASPPTSQSTEAKAPVKATRVKLEPAVRQQRFDEQVKYIEARIGRAPTIKDERVRKRHFLMLLDLAQSEKDVRKVVELVPRFKEAGGVLIGSFAKELARRCQELQCQQVALDVFGNFAKYDVPLDIEAARWLLHSVYIKRPLEDVLIVSALYPIYNLPPISTDLVSASLLAAACYKAGTPESIKAADALQPNIQAMLRKVQLRKAPDHETRKLNKWVSWALRKVNSARADKEPFVAQNALPLKIELLSSKAETSEKVLPKGNQVSKAHLPRKVKQT
ncbi:hypothetical protein HYPSUDRAFT_202919 [Hypholoma sublateritium FD-334 SS-4]|uniref:Uncharacterized protein n=1 Tax=Hypholoma sublateritium (strain FD-334 SS-4) TaxID=945553 RepID=A0A0D2NRZ8_HYPSF|nr:hypothetical protein HYPSUDRAFT_202919 [Hypholoma sublateritium FD-334 SS-4]